jgi:NAD(P)-dependent dehydrogenase (short-subunit alcohol dehydrogenase family)
LCAALDFAAGDAFGGIGFAVAQRAAAHQAGVAVATRGGGQVEQHGAVEGVVSVESQ